MSGTTSFGNPRCLSWTIELPERHRASLGRSKPRASLVIWPADEREERVMIPVAVARALQGRGSSGELRPASRAELLYVLHEQERVCARTRLERLLDRRDYSAEEVRRKLAEDGYGHGIVDELVDRACAAHLICDERYAEVFIRSKVAAGWGMNRITRELSCRGVDVDELDGWPYAYLDPEDEYERALEVAQRRSVSEPNRMQKLARYLAARGFSTNVAYSAARDALQASDWA